MLTLTFNLKIYRGQVNFDFSKTNQDGGRGGVTVTTTISPGKEFKIPNSSHN